MARLFQGGLGGESGGALSAGAPFFTTKHVWFVHYTDGDDAAADGGRNEKFPLKTLQAAINGSEDGDVIVLLAGHVEPYSGITVDKAVTVVGLDTASGKPTCKLYPSAADASVACTGDLVQFHNVWFGVSTLTQSGGKIHPSCSVMFRMVGCYVEMDENDTTEDSLRNSGTALVWVDDTVFESASSAEAGPYMGINLNAAADLVCLVTDVTLDGGESGFASGYGMAIDLPDPGTDGYIAVESLSLLNGADVWVYQDTSSVAQGYITLYGADAAGNVFYEVEGE